MRPKPFLIVALVGALLGFVFAGFSTYDFAQHLDRQVHSVHCSFVPGLAEGESGGSDCEVTLMSTYSSVFRSSVWGGIPVSLPAMSVFAFLMFFGVDLLIGRRQRDRRATGFFVLACALPALTSLVMGYISLSVLDAACKLCIGIYVSSALALIGSVGLWWRAGSSSGGSDWGDDFESEQAAAGEEPAWANAEGLDGEEQIGGGADDTDPPPSWESPDGQLNRQQSGEPIGWAKLVGFFALGVVFVAVPVSAYYGTAPDHSQFIGTCGSVDSQPNEDLLVEMGPQDGVPALEVFDPLCPACQGFEEHLAETKYEDELARRAVLFPLDDECNWMLDSAVHPGACAVSEAVLCGEREGRAQEVIDWAFDQQKAIRKRTEQQEGAARDMIERRFPGLASCVGSQKVKNRLNRSLRWTVDAKLKILTPQIFVDGVRLCDEDVDLGLEFALSRMIERYREGTLRTKDDSGDKEEQ